MSLRPATPAAYKLLQDGAIAASRIEAAGLRVDVGYLDKAIEEVTARIRDMEQEITDHKIVKLWKNHYGLDMKMNSRVQLGRVVFDILGHKRNPFLGNSNSEIAFKHLSTKVPFLGPDGAYFGIAKLKKALSTYLLGLKREVVDGYVHPFIDMHTAESYRPSSSKPNMFNFPRRNKIIAKIVRESIIPRYDYLLEADYSAQEVRIAACYCKDPKLIEYVTGGGDQHYDASLDIYLLSKEEMGSIDKGQPGADVRDIVKNKWVFPQNYGSYYTNCAPDLYEAIEEFNLRTAQGLSLYDHLKNHGIKKLGKCDPELDPQPGTFEHHLKEAQQEYWSRLEVYDQWRKDWWSLYQQQGGVNSLTGFCQHGLFRRNQILCDCIQGSAWHCLLWAMIQIQNQFIKRKMKTKIVNCIYDALLFDVPHSELDEVVGLTREYALDKVVKHWPWIIVPLNVDFQGSDKNWYDKHKMEGIAA